MTESYSEHRLPYQRLVEVAAAGQSIISFAAWLGLCGIELAAGTRRKE